MSDKIVILHDITPEIWFKIQRMKAKTEERIEEITAIYEKWKGFNDLEKIPFKIRFPDGTILDHKVWITGFKTNGKDLFTEYKLTQKGPKLTQIIKA